MADTLNSLFNENDTITTEVESTTSEATTKKKSAVKDAFKKTIQEDANFLDKVSTLSKSVKVVNTLGFGAGGNIIVDKQNTDSRKLKQTSKIVGYKLQNIGNEPLKYSTMSYKKDADGKFVGTKVEKTAAPGETFCLNRMWMTVFCMKPEISFTLANGKVVAGSGGKTKGADNVEGSVKIEQLLESHYFTFNPDENGHKPEVNDDDVKVAIDDPTTKKVLPEYEETFGNLNNAKEPKAKAPKNDKITTQVMVANYINSLAKEAGLD